ncbi:MAG: hypothetical protein K0Q55_2251 [Verrucomicrobia bacterium]|nr:hypothetical protein [Verrucomicrobiota bacterium]
MNFPAGSIFHVLRLVPLRRNTTAIQEQQIAPECCLCLAWGTWGKGLEFWQPRSGEFVAIPTVDAMVMDLLMPEMASVHVAVSGQGFFYAS